MESQLRKIWDWNWGVNHPTYSLHALTNIWRFFTQKRAVSVKSFWGAITLGSGVLPVSWYIELLAFSWILIISISPKKENIQQSKDRELLLKEDMAETDHFYPCLGLAGFLLLVSIPNIFLVYQARKYRSDLAFINDIVFLQWYFIKGKVPQSTSAFKKDYLHFQ